MNLLNRLSNITEYTSCYGENTTYTTNTTYKKKVG